MKKLVRLAIVGLAAGLVAACKPDYRNLSPAAVVSKAFMAYRNADMATFNMLISTTGTNWAEAHCRYGQAIQCLVRQYEGAQHLVLYSTEPLTETTTAAEVLLRSTWSVLPDAHYCQVFTLEKTDVGWKIMSIDKAKACIEPTATPTP